MNVQDAIRTRVSVKDYRGDPVPDAVVETLIELANLAPNHRMTEPLEYRVMGDGAKRAYAHALAARKTARIEDAGTAEAVRDRVVTRTTSVPAMVAVLVHQDEDPEVREEDWATAFMAIQNLSLAAVDMGLGTHIKTGAVMEEPALRGALDARGDQRVAAIVFLGAPAEVPESKPRTAAAERTRWLE
jgi:nitroreductase